MPTRLSAVLAFVFALMLSTSALAQSSHASDNAGGNGSDRSQRDNGSGNGNSEPGGTGNDSSTDIEISDDDEAESHPESEAEPESLPETEAEPESLPETEALPEPGSGAETEVDGAASGAPETGGKPTTDQPAAKLPTGSPERQALDAREAGEAVALEDLLPAVRTEGSEVLDAQLLTISGELVYELKVLSPSGTLSTQYFLARTGRPIVRQ